MASAIKRHFCGEILAYLSVAATCMMFFSSTLLGFPVTGVTPVGAGNGELTQLVTHHVFRYQDGYVLAAVMDRYCQTNHVRQNHRTTRPCPDGPSIVDFCRCCYLVRQMRIDERAFPN
jgi:hypothetical protein